MRGVSFFNSTFLAALVLAIAACGPTATQNQGERQDAPPPIQLPSDGSSGCRGVPESGRCNGDAAVYCDSRSSALVEKRCGARGLVCEETLSGARCVDENGEEQEVPVEGDQGEATDGGACGEVTNDGECDGMTLRYCSNITNQIKEVDCSTKSATTEYQCGFDEGAGYFDCMPADYGECDPELYAGERCSADGTAVEFCYAESLTVGSEACGDDSVCRDFNEPGFEYSDCEQKSCEELGWEGKCNADGTAYTYCSATNETPEIWVDQCSAGTTCGYDADGWAECK